MESIALKDTRQLIQSTELTYARYEFFKSKGIEITMTNYKLLFLGEKNFSKRFRITNDEITTIYPYKEERKKLKKEVNKSDRII